MSKLLAVRIPENLICKLKSIRKRNGTVISHFVTEAITEKINEMKEYAEDIAIIETRKNESSMTEAEWNKYLKSRDIRV